ncbi:MAG: rhodanese-like domain-containing protein [Bdellovibrionales bacterium]|nr:rhodanese-like domain-containing protein [Bdellovibrionales bacterium]
MKLITGVVLSLAFALSAHGMDCKDDATYGDISKSELQTLVKEDKVVTLDANDSKRFKKGAIGKAVHFDKKREIASILPKGTAKDQLIVAYCGGPGCEAWKDAAVKACEAGYTNVKHFSAGITGWEKN